MVVVVMMVVISVVMEIEGEIHALEEQNKLDTD